MKFLGAPSQRTSEGPSPEQKFKIQDVQLEPHIKSSMGSVDIKLMHLRELFNTKNPLEVRMQAATKINQHVRGFIARKHFQHYQRGLREWKWSRCRHIVFVFDLFLETRAKMEAGLQQIELNRHERASKRVFSKWAIITKQNGPLRRSIRAAAEGESNISDQMAVAHCHSRMCSFRQFHTFLPHSPLNKFFLLIIQPNIERKVWSFFATYLRPSSPQLWESSH